MYVDSLHIQITVGTIHILCAYNIDALLEELCLLFTPQGLFLLSVLLGIPLYIRFTLVLPPLSILHHLLQSFFLLLICQLPICKDMGNWKLYIINYSEFLNASDSIFFYCQKIPLIWRKQKLAYFTVNIKTIKKQVKPFHWGSTSAPLSLEPWLWSWRSCSLPWWPWPFFWSGILFSFSVWWSRFLYFIPLSLIRRFGVSFRWVIGF